VVEYIYIDVYVTNTIYMTLVYIRTWTTKHEQCRCLTSACIPKTRTATTLTKENIFDIQEWCSV